MFQTTNQIYHTDYKFSHTSLWICQPCLMTPDDNVTCHAPRFTNFVGSERSHSSCTKAAEQAQGCLVLGPESAPFGAFARNQNEHPK